jgi:hypothetical protein
VCAMRRGGLMQSRYTLVNLAESSSLHFDKLIWRLARLWHCAGVPVRVQLLAGYRMVGSSSCVSFVCFPCISRIQRILVT